MIRWWQAGVGDGGSNSTLDKKHERTRLGCRETDTQLQWWPTIKGPGRETERERDQKTDRRRVRELHRKTEQRWKDTVRERNRDTGREKRRDRERKRQAHRQRQGGTHREDKIRVIIRCTGLHVQ